MRRLAYLVAPLALMASLRGESITDLVRAERERKTKSPPPQTVVFTNADLDKCRRAGHVTSNSLTREKPQAKERARGGTDRTWRNRMVKIDRRIETLQSKITDYEAQIKSLSKDLFTGNTRLWYRREARLRNLEQRKKRAESDLRFALEEKSAIESDARKSGVLPGVLRGQKY